MNDNNEPAEGSVWRHRSGGLYVVLFLTNKNDRPDTYPRTVVYQGTDGHRWSRPLADWSRSMTAGCAEDVKTFVFRSAAWVAAMWLRPSAAGPLDDGIVRPPAPDFTVADLAKELGAELRTDKEWAERRRRADMGAYGLRNLKPEGCAPPKIPLDNA